MRKFMLLLLATAGARAGNSISLATPYLVPLNPVVSAYQYSAYQGTTEAYKTVLTGFSQDGNYVLGQVMSHFTCGHSGRGANIHTYFLCTFLKWDLSGNLVGTETMTAGAKTLSCPSVPLNAPSLSPPSNQVVGNGFVNAVGYVAETLVQEVCGSIACYETLLYPTLITPTTT